MRGGYISSPLKFSMKKLLSLLAFCALFAGACTDIHHYSDGPGYDFNNFKHTPVWDLARAVADDDTAKIGAILKDKRIDVDCPDPKFGLTLLMLAVEYEQERSVEKLLQCGANPNAHKNQEDESPLIHCCFFISGTKILKLLIEYGGDVNSIHIMDHRKGGDGSWVNETPLMAAASDPKVGCLDKVKMLVESGADINKCTYYEGYGAITTAIIMENLVLS